MTVVHAPSPHPKSPTWHRTEVGVGPKRSVTSWLTVYLFNMTELSQITAATAARTSRHKGFMGIFLKTCYIVSILWPNRLA